MNKKRETVVLSYNNLRNVAGLNKFDSKKATQLLVIIRNTKIKRKREQKLIDLFYLVNNATLKNIENFYYLTRPHASWERVINMFPKDDLVGEAYHTFHKCTINFCRKNKDQDLRDGQYDPDLFEYVYSYKFNFFFYYNTSLSRSFYRKMQKWVKKHKLVQNEENNSYLINNEPSYQNKIDLNDFDLKNIGFTEMEMNIIHSRVARETIEDFVKRTKSMNTNIYYKILNIIKQKFNNSYGND